MPALCQDKNGVSLSGLRSDSYSRTMSESEPSLCKSKSNNNKTSDQNGRCASSIGILDTRRRANSASNAHVENGKICNGSASVINGLDSHNCRDICVLLAHDVVYTKSKGEDQSSGWLCKYKQNGVQITNEYTKTMQRTVSEISERHEILFSSMVKKLNITRDNFEEVFVSVVDDIFSDGETNWGRVVTVYALGGKMAEFLTRNDMDDCLDTLAERVGSYVYNVIGGWIIDNGGWDAFVRFFPERSNPEERVWNGLVWTAAGLMGAAGLATLFAMKT